MAIDPQDEFAIAIAAFDERRRDSRPSALLHFRGDRILEIEDQPVGR